MRLAAVVVAGALLGTALPAVAQRATVAAPPADTAGSGGFTLRRLAGPVKVDGETWRSVQPRSGEPPVFKPAGATYQLRFTDLDEDSDFSRWALRLERPDRPSVSLTAGGKTAFAYVTPDTRFIVMEPLMVVDMQRWRRYALHHAFALPAYQEIVAVSGDGRRLLIRGSDCAADCKAQPRQYFELTLPR